MKKTNDTFEEALINPMIYVANRHLEPYSKSIKKRSVKLEIMK